MNPTTDFEILKHPLNQIERIMITSSPPNLLQLLINVLQNENNKIIGIMFEKVTFSNQSTLKEFFDSLKHHNCKVKELFFRLCSINLTPDNFVDKLFVYIGYYEYPNKKKLIEQLGKIVSEGIHNGITKLFYDHSLQGRDSKRIITKLTSGSEIKELHLPFSIPTSASIHLLCRYFINPQNVLKELSLHGSKMSVYELNCFFTNIGHVNCKLEYLALYNTYLPSQVLPILFQSLIKNRITKFNSTLPIYQVNQILKSKKIWNNLLILCSVNQFPRIGLNAPMKKFPNDLVRLTHKFLIRDEIDINIH